MCVTKRVFVWVCESCGNKRELPEDSCPMGCPQCGSCDEYLIGIKEE